MAAVIGQDSSCSISQHRCSEGVSKVKSKPMISPEKFQKGAIGLSHMANGWLGVGEGITFMCIPTN